VFVIYEHDCAPQARLPAVPNEAAPARCKFCRQVGIHLASVRPLERYSQVMEANELIAVLEGEGHLDSVVTALGNDCLARRQEVENDRDADPSDRLHKLRQLVAEESEQIWNSDGTRRGGPSAELRKQVSGASITPALTTITILEGICAGAARIYFARASGMVTVKRGSVLPLPERWLAKIRTTPKLTTMHPNLLGEWCNFVLWESEWVVELDYTFRDRLDLVCAVRLTGEDVVDASGVIRRLAYGLPKIATVHPFDGDDMDMTKLVHAGRPKRFFGVRAKYSSAETHQKAFDALAKAGGHAPIAVLPEFTLHSPDGLDALIASNTTLPLAELVVAGSAHVDVGGVRANTSHVLLDRHPILSISKYQPFVMRGKDDQKTPVSFTEDIRRPPRVLRLAAGTATRLAIAICSDLNSLDLVQAMTCAGVNLLLSPSWTPRIGGSDKALEMLAGYCQCIGVIANAPGHPAAVGAEKTRPLWACSAGPLEEDHAHFHRHCGAPRPVAGVLDPNLPPTGPGYWTWVV